MIYKKRVVIVNDNDLSNDINSAQEAADSAILEQQRIYYRSKEGRIPYGAADPTDIWITNHDDRYNELSNENAVTAWSTKITPIARGIDSNENEDKYLYLYTCVQKRIVSKDAVNYTLSLDTTVNASKLYYERSGMTDNYVYTVISNPSGNPHENQYYEQSPKVPHTEILLDETTTVIDGGKIITGSVMANRLNAASINAWHQLSIGAFDANTTKAISNSTYITFIDTQTGIRVHNVEDENNYVQINATDIQLIRANTPRMILGATNFGFSDANGTQRLLLNATDGAIIGYINNIYTQIKNEGFYIYNGASNQTNKKLTQITSSGLEIFDSADGSSAAIFGATARIGKSGAQRIEITNSAIDIYNNSGKVAEYGSSINLASNEATVTIGNTNKYHTVLTNSGMYFKNGANTTSQNLLTITGNEIKLYKSNTTTAAVTINSSGKLTASDVDLTGKITADDGKIGGWTINADHLAYETWGTSGGAMIKPAGTSSAKSIGGSDLISGWVLTLGANFGVTKTGAMYATSGKIAGWGFDDNQLAKTSGVISGRQYQIVLRSNVSTDDTYAAFMVQSRPHDGTTAGAWDQWPFFVRYNGTVHASKCDFTGGTIGGWTISGTSLYNKTNGDNNGSYFVGMTTGNAGTSSWVIGAAVRESGAWNYQTWITGDGWLYSKRFVARDTNNKNRAFVDTNGLTIKDTDGSTTVANFGSTATIGKNNSNHILINNTETQFLYNTTSLGTIAAYYVNRVISGLSINASGSLDLQGSSSATLISGGKTIDVSSTGIGINGSTSIVGNTNITGTLYTSSNATINGNLSILGSIANLFTIVTYNYSHSGVQGNSYISAADYTISVPSGYQAVGVVGWTTNSWRLRVTHPHIKSSTVLRFGLGNDSSSAVEAGTASLKILCLKATGTL